LVKGGSYYTRDYSTRYGGPPFVRQEWIGGRIFVRIYICKFIDTCMYAFEDIHLYIYKMYTHIYMYTYSDIHVYICTLPAILTQKCM